MDKHAHDNRANQLNPNHPAYWQTRRRTRPNPAPDGAVKPAEKSPTLQSVRGPEVRS